MTFITSEMVVLSVMVSSRIPTKSVQIVQIVHVMTFFGSEMNKNNFGIRNSYFCFFVKICGELLKDHNAVIPQGLSFSFKDHTMPTSRFQNNNSSRRRSKSYSDLGWNHLFTSLAG